MTTAIILLAIAAAIFLLTRKNKSPSKSGWRMEHSPGAKPLVMQGAGWFFDFPAVPTGHVHYVQWFDPPPLVGAEHITVRFRVTGGGFVPQEFPDGRPATVSLLIQRKGDNWSADAKTKSYRWYSSEAQQLAAGDYQMTVPLDVSAWGDVYNGKDANAFADAVRNVDNIGLVFGSAGGRGHGVYATQPSRFTLLDISL